MNKIIKFILVTALSVTSFGYLSAEKTEQVEEIIVTAQKRESSLQDTPIAITAFNESTLEQKGVSNFYDIGHSVPNLLINKQPASNNNAGFAIRGFSSGETQLLMDPKVAVYLDGVYLARMTGTVFEIIDLERIEVLRGPQGTLQGRNSIGGAVNIISKAPSGEFSFKGKLSAGNFGLNKFNASLDTDKWGALSAKFSVATTDREGLMKNTVAPSINPYRELGDDDRQGYRVALRLDHDTWTLDYVFDREESESNAMPFQMTLVNDMHVMLGGKEFSSLKARIGNNPLKRKKYFELDATGPEFVEVQGEKITYNQELGERNNLKVIAAHREYDSQPTGTDLDDGAYVLHSGGVNNFPANTLGFPLFHAADSKKGQEQDSFEVQLVGEVGDLKYVFGGYYFEEEVWETNPQYFSLPGPFLAASSPTTCAGPPFSFLGLCNFGATAPLGAPLFEYGGDTESTAYFMHFDYAVSDTLNVQLGLRHTEDKKSAYMTHTNLLARQQGLRTAFSNIPSGAPGVSLLAALQAGGTLPANWPFDLPLRDEDEWTNTSGELAFIYRPTEDLTYYAKYSTGYNSGGFNARTNGLISTSTGIPGIDLYAPLFNTPFDEETVESTELGIKASLMDKKLQINLAVFAIDGEDMQQAEFIADSSGATSRTANTGEETHDGFEIEATYVPTPGLIINFGYGETDVDIKSYPYRCTDAACAPLGIYGQVLDGTNAAQMAQIGKNPAKKGFSGDGSATLGVQYESNPIDLGTLIYRLDVNWRDAVAFHPFDYGPLFGPDQKAHTLVNARITLADMATSVGDGTLELSVWGKNLTDEEFINWGINFGGLGFAGGTFNAPRTFGVDVSVRF